MAANVIELQQLLVLYINTGEDRERMREVLQITSVEDRYNALVSAREEYQYTAIHKGAVLGDLDSLKCMMSGFTTDQWYTITTLKDSFGVTPLPPAASMGYTEVIMFLLSKIPPELRFNTLRMQDIAGSTALHQAAKNNHTVTLQVMLTSVSPELQKQLLDIKDDRDKRVADIIPVPELPYNVAAWSQQELDVTNQKLAEVEKHCSEQKAAIDDLKVTLVRQREDNFREVKQQAQELMAANQKLEDLESFCRELQEKNQQKTKELLEANQRIGALEDDVDQQREDNALLSETCELNREELRSLGDRQERMENMMEEMERLLRQPICIGPEMDQEHEG